jgi:ABC-type transporter Mla subunit MlaD
VRYTVTRMPDNATPGLGDLLSLLGNNNPFSGMTRSIAQFQRGVNEFLNAVENLNGALEQFNGLAARVNSLLDLVEEPLKVLVPQVTRTLRATDDLVDRLSGPVDRVAPGLTRLADTLSNPAFTALPRDLNEFLGVLRDFARRMQPLGQMAETASGLFSRGPFASLLGGGTTNREPAPAPVPAPVVAIEPEPVRPIERSASTAVRKSAAKRATATKAAAKKSSRSSATPAKRG